VVKDWFSAWLHVSLFHSYAENKLRIQREVALQMPVKVNTWGVKRSRQNISISTSPLKRRTPKQIVAVNLFMYTFLII
jgi:hypothetical protein